MYTQVEKSKKNKSRAVANSVVQNKIDAKQGLEFVDNRQETTIQNLQQFLTDKTRIINQPKTCQQQMSGNEGLIQSLGIAKTHKISVSRTGGVIQRGTLYNDVENKTRALEEGDYVIASVLDEDILDATKEIIGEYLSGLTFFSDFDGSIPIPAAQNWTVALSNSFSGGAGSMSLPNRLQTLMQIHTGTFKANLAHEMGHAIRAVKGVSGWAKMIDQLSKSDDCNSKQNEELRADITGVILRWLEGDNPIEEDYRDLFDEPESRTHPDGKLRKKKIKDTLVLCAQVDSLMKK